MEMGKMSTYLLAFTIGRFKAVSAQTSRGITVQTIAEPYLEKYLADSAKISANCIDAMEGLINISFPWSKLDNVEMLQMGHFSAMENTGLIIYTRFLSQLPIMTPAHKKINQMITMCHETSHQWFGDLVTADHWGLEFLHESLATYFENRAIQQFRSEKELFENLMVLNKDTGLYSSKNIDHAVVSDKAYFDDVTYLSGGSIIRMFERLLGSDDFFAALTNYLKNNKFGNADEISLISEFEKAKNNQNLCGNLEMRTIMTDFLRKPHHPVIFVSTVDGYYQFDQTQGDNVWTVPIFAYNLRTGEELVGYSLVNGSTCPDKWLKANDPYIFNYKSTTFARFRYDTNIINAILASNLGKLDDSTLLGLLLDEIEYEREKWVFNYDFQPIIF
jgi:aminopeptidase N